MITGLVMHMHGPVGKLDSKIIYSISYAESFFAGLSSSQISDYLICEYFDLWFLTNYSLLGFLLAHQFFKGKWKLLLFVPALLDLWETTNIIFKLKDMDISLSLLAFSSSLKWLSGIILILYVVFRWFQKKSIDA